MNKPQKDKETAMNLKKISREYGSIPDHVCINCFYHQRVRHLLLTIRHVILSKWGILANLYPDHS